MTQPSGDRPTDPAPTRSDPTRSDPTRSDPTAPVSRIAAALAVDTDETRAVLETASRRLLGATISISDQEWREPSLLPDWTRAHVASHLCRHADAFGRLAAGARTGTAAELYPNDRDVEIAEGADRDGLALQTDLDTSTGRLDGEFEQLAAAGRWQQPVQLRRGIRVPAALLPMGRLFEVAVHHVDLDIGYGFDDLDQRSAGLCLLWAAIRQQSRTDYPALRLVTADGTAIDIGAAETTDPVRIAGPAPRLLGWLTGRIDQSGLDGPSTDLPSFG